VPKNPLDLANGQQTGMPEFLPACGLRVNLTGICSSIVVPPPDLLKRSLVIIQQAISHVG
jgi:hypothetical protein